MMRQPVSGLGCEKMPGSVKNISAAAAQGAPHCASEVPLRLSCSCGIKKASETKPLFAAYTDPLWLSSGSDTKHLRETVHICRKL